MNATTKKALKVGLPILLAVFFGWYTFSKFPLNDVLPHIKTANFSWIALGVFCGILSHLSRAYRWKYLIEPMGYTLKFPNSVMAVFAAYLTNFGIPRSGEMLRAAVITNYENVPFEKAFGTIVAERVADFIILMAIVAIALILQFEFIFNILEQSFQLEKLLLLGSVGLLFCGLLFLFLKRSSSKIAVKVRGFVKGLFEGVFSIFKMKHKWAFIGHTLFIWAMYILMFYVTIFAVNDLNNVTFAAILIAFIAGSFAITATNGGLFFFPLAITAAFALFDIPENPSLAFGWIMWTSQTLMIIILGSLSFLFLPIYNRSK